MATNIPPHNLGEVCDALCYLIDRYDRHDDVTVEDLMQFIPGPDFPTGGVIYRYQREGSGEAAEQVDVIAHAYAGGKGHIVMQAKAHIEDMSRNRARIVITELPYMTNKTNLLERIAELVRDGRLDGITDLRDESDRTGMRICIEMTRTVEPREVLASLFKLTPLQQTFGVSLLALVDSEPRLLSLKRMLLYFLEHRQEVIVRRSKYELAKARARAHILEGLLRALDVLDEIIALIRASKTADVAKQGLIKDFKFSEIQAQAILDMQLRRLAALERRRLQDEYREVIALIRTLEELLNSPKKVLTLIRQNLVDLKARYGDTRRTQIADRVQGTLTTHDLLPDEDVWVTLSPEGALTKWRRGDPASEPKGKAAPAHLRAPAPQIVAANTRDDLYLFSVKGQATRIGAHQVPEGSGSHFADLSGLTRRDRIAAMVALPKSMGDQEGGPLLLLATVQGKVKRVAVVDLMDQASADPQVIGLDDGDELLWAGISPGGGEFLLVTAQGQAIRFAEDDVRAMGLAAGGIGGVKLAAKDRVVAANGDVQRCGRPAPRRPAHDSGHRQARACRRLSCAGPQRPGGGCGQAIAEAGQRRRRDIGRSRRHPALSDRGRRRQADPRSQRARDGAARTGQVGDPARGRRPGDADRGRCSRERTKAKDEVEVKAEAKTETKTKTAARRAAAKPATGAVKSSAPSKTAAAGKAAPVKSSATAAKKTSGTPPTAASVAKAGAGAATKIAPAATPPAGSTAKPAVARKAAAGQPSLLAAEAAAPAVETKTRSTARATPAKTDAQKPAVKAGARQTGNETRAGKVARETGRQNEQRTCD